MDGSVLGALRLDDSDCLRSGIFGEEADVLVFVSAVEGIPSPSLARVCFLFECWFPWNLRFLQYPVRTFGMIYLLNGKIFVKVRQWNMKSTCTQPKWRIEHEWIFRKVPYWFMPTSNAPNKSNEDPSSREGYQGKFFFSVRWTALGFFPCFSM